MTALEYDELVFTRCNATQQLHNLALLKLRPLVITLKIRRHASLSNVRQPCGDKHNVVQRQTGNMHEGVQVRLQHTCTTERKHKQ